MNLRGDVGQFVNDYCTSAGWMSSVDRQTDKETEMDDGDYRVMDGERWQLTALVEDQLGGGGLGDGRWALDDDLGVCNKITFHTT